MAFQDEDEVGGKMSDKKFEGDPLDYTSLFVEARRAREAEKNLDAALSLAHSGIEKLEAENANLHAALNTFKQKSFERGVENAELKKQLTNFLEKYHPQDIDAKMGKLEAEKATYADSYDLLAKQGIELQKENAELKKLVKLQNGEIRYLNLEKR